MRSPPESEYLSTMANVRRDDGGGFVEIAGWDEGRHQPEVNITQGHTLNTVGTVTARLGFDRPVRVLVEMGRLKAAAKHSTPAATAYGALLAQETPRGRAERVARAPIDATLEAFGGFDEGGLRFEGEGTGLTVRSVPAGPETFMPVGTFRAHPMDGIRVVVWSELREGEFLRWTGWLWRIHLQNEGGTMDIRAAETCESPQSAAREAANTLRSFIIKAVRTAVEGKEEENGQQF